MIRKSLGRQLRALRVAARKSQADAADVGSVTKIKNMEAGRIAQRYSDVVTLCFMYKADEPTTARLTEMARMTATEDGWWESYTDATPQWFSTYIELEAAASVLDAWDPEIIHGLLQTPDYQRAMFELYPEATPEYARRQLELRAARQRAAFDRTQPLFTRAVIGEGAVRRLVGGRDVMDEQLKHLRHVNGLAHIDVRILTYEAGAHVAMKGAFTVITFDPGLGCVYLETEAGGRHVWDGEVIDGYRQMADAIRAQSTPLEEYLK